MTEIEFEAKLATVSDAKLRSMLASSRSHGPEIAVKLILSEGKARGLDGLEDDVKKDSKVEEESEEMEVSPSVEAAMAAAASQAIGYSEGSAQDESNPDALPENESSEEMPPVGANWLNEENRPNRMPVAVKALVFLAALGALILGALKFIQRG